MQAPFPTKVAIRGFSLMEALVTVLVISIGLLGVAGLQAAAKKANYEAVQRTTATLLAQDMIERLRANAGELDEFAGKTVTGNTLTEPSPVCNTANPCKPAQLAAHDLWEWEQMLYGATERQAGSTTSAGYTGGLVEPTGCIAGPAGGGVGTYTVTIAWHGSAAGANPTTNTCGESATRYGTDNAYRRVLTLDVFITPLAGGL